MTRLIAGTAGGRRLRTPRGPSTRPTSARVREALFSRLDHLGVLDGATVLDLYAGSGALGLEAASRGAAHVTLVDSGRPAAQAARRNALELGLQAQVVAEPVERFLLSDRGERPAADLVLADPPYDLDQEALGQVLALLVVHGWLTGDAMVVVERAARSGEPLWPLGLSVQDHRRYGDTSVWFAARDAGSTVA